MFVPVSFVPKNIIPSEAAIECTSSKGIFVCPWLTNTPEDNLKEYILPSELLAKTAAPPSITSVTSCVGSISTIVDASVKSEDDHVLLKGFTSHKYAAVPSLPLIHNLCFINHTPVSPPLPVCAVVCSDHEEPSYFINSDADVPFAVVRYKPFPNAAMPVKLWFIVKAV